MLNFINLFDVYNEGEYKVLVFFGFKIRIRSKVLMLREQMKETRRKIEHLEKRLREQQKAFEEFRKLIEQKLTDSEGRGQLRIDSVEHCIESVRQEMNRLAEQTSAGIQGMSVQLGELVQLQQDSRCSANDAAIQEVSHRLAVLEQLQLGKACEKLHYATVAVEQRLSELEQLQLDQKVSQQQRALHKMDEQVAGIRERLAPLANQKAVKFLKSKKFLAINRDYVASLVENYSGRGVSDREGVPELIVSLTSYPKRMYDIHLCLYSLLTQDLKPDKVILWLAEEQFPHRLKDVPKKVRDLKKFGLEIKWCSDLKSYKKLIPALQQYPDACIVTADDDIYYPENWLRGLWETQQHTGAGVVAHRCHEAVFEGGSFLPYAKWPKCIEREAPSYTNFMTGAGGILYAPGCFHPDIMNVAKFQELCPHGDDIWFWTMALLNGTKIAIPPQPYRNLVYTNPEREVNANDDGTLFAVNGAGGNDVQLANVLAAYPELGALLQAES